MFVFRVFTLAITKEQSSLQNRSQAILGFRTSMADPDLSPEGKNCGLKATSSKSSPADRSGKQASGRGSDTVNKNTDFNRNNLDLLRLILASTVALFHIYALTNIPAFAIFNTYLSPHFAVKGFFVISGMLIYRSYTRSSTVRSYFEKRVRRIYPAYFTVITVTAALMCFVSSLPPSNYISLGLLKYLGANLLFLNFLAPSLPGVFASHLNPAVNGALWTLKIEVLFYLSVPLIHSLCTRFGTKKAVSAVFAFSCAWKYGFAWLDHLQGAAFGAGLDGPRTIFAKLEVQFPAQLAYFTAGVLLLLYFDTLKTRFLSIFVISSALYLTDHFFAHERLDIFWISGIVFAFGFCRYFGNVSKYGDFSYGVYIVHWPIIQVLIAFGIASLDPGLFLFLAISITAFTSFLMWHLVEKKFLASGSHYRQSPAAVPEPVDSLVRT